MSFKVSQLTNAKHYNYMRFVLAATGQFHLLCALFEMELGVLQKAFSKEKDLYLKHNRSFLTPEVQEAESVRDTKFRILRDRIKTARMESDPAVASTADFLYGILKDYGGGRIPSMHVDAESGVLDNLCDDLLEKYSDKLELLGLTTYAADLKQANDAYMQLAADRTLDESKTDKGALATARKATDTSYRGFVAAVNLYVLYHGDEGLLDFIKFLNKEIEKQRIQLGQGPGNASESSGEEDLEEEEEEDKDEDSENNENTEGDNTGGTPPEQENPNQPPPPTGGGESGFDW